MEEPLIFECEGKRLVGIAHVPENPRKRGVVVIVGGPQYRIGSHRQFVLLARHLSSKGFCTLRFDCRGMGDSEGAHPGFEHLSPDIRAAIDALFRRLPSLEDAVLWGLCDAASAALIYAQSDPRVSGVVLSNPWVHVPGQTSTAYVRSYYLKRIRSADFWTRLMTRAGAVGSAALAVKAVTNAAKQGGRARAGIPGDGYRERMYSGAAQFAGRVLLILSGEDLVAMEFESLAKSHAGWRRLLRSDRWQVHKLEGATHTFSKQAWRDQVAKWTADWLGRW